MFTNTDLVGDLFTRLEEDYHDYVAAESLPDTPLIHYVYYKQALEIIKSQPLNDPIAQQFVELRLQSQMLDLAVENQLRFATIHVA